MITLVAMRILLTWISLTSSQTPESISKEISILRTGTFHGDEIKAVSGETWFGLFPSTEGFELIRTQISVEEVYDPILDDRKGAYTGKKVSSSSHGEPLVMIKGIAGLSEGPVKTVFGGTKFIYPAEHLSLKFGENDYYSLRAFGEAVDRPGDVLLKNYTIEFSHMGRRQIIAMFERLAMDGSPELIWAGDLDRDGRLDLLLDLTDHYNVQLYSLFLSSQAGPHEIVKLVAQFRHVGC